MSLRETRKERLRKCVTLVILRLFNSKTEEDDFSGFSVQEWEKDSNRIFPVMLQGLFLKKKTIYLIKG